MAKQKEYEKQVALENKLKEQCYAAMRDIIKPHGLTARIVFYPDKRDKDEC